MKLVSATGITMSPGKLIIVSVELGERGHVVRLSSTKGHSMIMRVGLAFEQAMQEAKSYVQVLRSNTEM